MNIIVLLNGPPRSGKDTFAKMLCNLAEQVFEERAMIAELKAPLREAGYVFLPTDWQARPYEEIKDLPIQFNGKEFTLRELMIRIAEKSVKPLMGGDIFAAILAEKIRSYKPSLAVVTDVGFAVEVETLKKALPDYKCYLIHMFRKGRDFSSDSRNYIYYEQAFQLHNNGSLADLQSIAVRYFQRFRDGLSIG